MRSISCSPPAAQRGWISDRVPQLGEIPVDDPIEVAVELGPQWPARQMAHAGEAGVQHLPNVDVDPEVGASLDWRTVAGQQLSKAYRGRIQTSLRQRQWAHSNADYPARTGVGLHFGRQCRAGQGIGTWIGARIDGTSHEVPTLGHMLPLVDEDRRIRIQQPCRISASNAALRRIVECVDAGRPSTRGGGLADAFCADDRYCGKRTLKLLELSVHDPSQVLLRSCNLADTRQVPN